jgi:hypothetical protein
MPWWPWKAGKAAAADQDLILVSALEHGEIQLLAQIADETSLDGRLMGVLGFNGALLAADIAAKPVLHFWWWSPLPFVAFASYRCFTAIFQEETKLGPAALEFYAEYGGQEARAAREQLLADLDASRQNNTKRAVEMSKILRQSLRILFVGLFIAGALIAFATPTKVGSHVCKHPAKTCRTKARSSSAPVKVAGGWDTRGHWIVPPLEWLTESNSASHA